MDHFRYVIVGGGMAADAAARGVRELDSLGSIALICDEPDPPYSRPPLSKGLWQGKDQASVWRRTGELAGIELVLARRVAKLDLAAKRVHDADGRAYGFDRLLLATGGTPRRLPSGDDAIIYFRSLEDYRRLRALAGPGRRIAVIGGGFIGSEIAAALAGQGCTVTLLFPDAGIGARIFPPDLSSFLTGYYREKGVEVRPGVAVARVARRGDLLGIETENGWRGDFDAVVAGIGVQPNVGLARAAGLAVEDGIVVDRTLRSSHPDVFAAGDVARFEAPALGRTLRVEHEDNALTMGRAAGRAMAGDQAPYEHLPFFYSDLFDLGYEAVGELDPRLQMVADWREPFRQGVIYYLAGGRVRGVLLWNTWEQVDAARALISDPGPFAPADLLGRLPSP